MNCLENRHAAIASEAKLLLGCVRAGVQEFLAASVVGIGWRLASAIRRDSGVPRQVSFPFGMRNRTPNDIWTHPFAPTL